MTNRHTDAREDGNGDWDQDLWLAVLQQTLHDAALDTPEGTDARDCLRDPRRLEPICTGAGLSWEYVQKRALADDTPAKQAADAAQVPVEQKRSVRVQLEALLPQRDVWTLGEVAEALCLPISRRDLASNLYHLKRLGRVVHLRRDRYQWKGNWDVCL